MGLKNSNSFLLGVCLDAGTQTSIAIDSAYTFETSGDAFFGRWYSEFDQTSGTLDCYFFADSVTGSPTYGAELRNGPDTSSDPDRPQTAGSTLATVSTVSVTAQGWVQFSFTGVTLTAGNQYYCILLNDHGTPASNYATWTYRGGIDAHFSISSNIETQETGYTLDGFTTDPTVGTGTGCMCVVYNSGDQRGFPFVTTESAASNSDDRGNRLNADQDFVATGHSMTATTSNIDYFRIYQGSTKLAEFDSTNQRHTYDRSGIGRYVQESLSASTDYDFVIFMGASTSAGTLGTMGVAEGSVPADVKACSPVKAYVTGATPGSYTADTSKALAGAVFF